MEIKINDEVLETLKKLNEGFGNQEHFLEQKKKNLADLQVYIKTLQENLDKDRITWNDTVKQLPEVLQDLLSKDASAIERVRKEVPTKKKVSVGKANPEVITRLTKIFKGKTSLSETEIKNAYGKGNLKVANYVEYGILVKTEDDKYTLKPKS